MPGTHPEVFCTTQTPLVKTLQAVQLAPTLEQGRISIIPAQT
jgi:hypothetical protein